MKNIISFFYHLLSGVRLSVCQSARPSDVYLYTFTSSISSIESRNLTKLGSNHPYEYEILYSENERQNPFQTGDNYETVKLECMYYKSSPQESQRWICQYQ